MTKKIIPSQEMLDDLLKMGDKDFSKKWGTSLRIPIKIRKEYKIKSFNHLHGWRPRIVENGKEYKYCSGGGGHWDEVDNFGVANNRYDGIRGECRVHERERKNKRYKEKGGKEKARAWRKTPNAKNSLRNTWRKQTAIKNGAYVKWDREDEDRAYRVFAGKCGYCGERFRFEELEFDHFIPVSAGGKTEPSNMVPCCSVCNHGIGGKFNKDPEEWIFQRFRDDPKWIIQDVKRKLLKLSAY